MHKPPFLLGVRTCIRDPRAIPQRDFNRHRQDFLRTFDAWLKTSANPADALLELEATVNAARGLVALAFDQLDDDPLVSGTPAVKPGIP